ncbi:hypothetical protein N7539_003368 [Penicillium diatomitis]|uniref:Proteasome inhibitor PI31 subunit n=1 Tax=Penicillium diatomitis TaxID=2819901 RepID=A0A9W9XCD8_9EURO|nr:uncharacterized protein N7539_003368 [Penicillium diatomitis]KAJ5488478.1 hypothetical protein N7539_003368 [Penicillium diatomitis]
MATNNPLGAEHVLEAAAKALGNDPSKLQTAYEAVALIGHASLTDSIDSSLTESNALPAEWNAGSTYAFRYAHPQSSMQYLLKVSRLGNNAVVFALALGDDRTSSFDLPVKDYISPSALPLSQSGSTSDALRDVFISRARLNDLVGLFKINVIQRLAPGLYKEGYEDRGPRGQEQEPPEASRQRDRLRDDSLPQPARPYPFDDPLAEAPRRPNPPGDFAPPGFEDEYEINRPPRGYPPGFPGGRSPFNIGERDLYPAGLGPNDPLRGSIGPGFGGGGMHPTFDDPLFGGRGGPGGGYDPRAPPGARYDPPGPGFGPPSGRGRGPGGGGFGGFGGGFGGDII